MNSDTQAAAGSARPATFGEQRVVAAYTTLDHDQRDAVIAVKAAAANLIDTIDRLCPRSRLTSLALTDAESSAMWAVKAITNPANP